MICMTFVPSKNPRKQHTRVQTPADSEQWTANRVKLQLALAYWTTRSKSPRTSTMVTLVPRASLLGTRLLCNNNNNKMHHVRGACWFTIATSRSIAMTPFSSFGRTVSQKWKRFDFFHFKIFRSYSFSPAQMGLHNYEEIYINRGARKRTQYDQRNNVCAMVM